MIDFLIFFDIHENMYSLPYPPLTAPQYYILALLCGLFLFSSPLYSICAYLAILYFAYTSKIPSFFCVLFAYLLGIIGVSILEREPIVPEWYSSNNTYFIEAKVHDVRYTSDSKVQLILRDVIATEQIVFQSISKKNACNPNESGTIHYTKARTCAIGYPIHSQKRLSGYVLYTVVRDIPEVYVGQRIKGVFTIENIRSNENGDFSIQEYYKSQYIYYRARLREISTQIIYGEPTLAGRLSAFSTNRFITTMEKLYGKERLLQRKEYDTIAIASALLLGTRRYFSNTLEEGLRTAGLLHSIVLSGLHVSSLILFAFPLTFFLIRGIPSLVFSIPLRLITFVILILCAFIYASIASFPISYMRALCMLCIAYIFSSTYRRYTLLDILLYTILCSICIAPRHIFTLSLQLSCGAVLAIYLSLPLSQAYIQAIAQSRLPYIVRYVFQAIGSIVITSIAINIILFPLLVSSFTTLPYALFLNIVWLPILSCIVLPLLLIAFSLSLCGIMLPFVWYCGLLPINVLLEVLYYLQSYEWFDVLVVMRPHTMTTIAFYLTLGIVILVYNDKCNKRVLYSLCAISILCVSIPIGIRLYRYYDDTLTIDIYDVGKGQSILITHKNQRILVDAGERTPFFDVGERIISPLLTTNFFPSLTGLILTHQDSDHIGGAIFLSKYYRISNTYYNGEQTKETKIVQYLFSHINTNSLHIVREGDIITLTNDVALRILLPHDTIGKENKGSDKSNAQSIVLMVEYKGKNIALLLGDIDIRGQEYIVAKYGESLSCEMIILPHHGSRHNMYIPLYGATKASYAIASTAREDTNFISSSMQEALYTHGMELYTTYRHGRISYKYKNGEGNISYMRAEKY